MYISERQIRIIVSNIVSEFRHHVFNPDDSIDIGLAYQESRSKLDGIALIFSEGKLSRFIKSYQDDLFQLGQLASKHITKRAA